MKSQKLSPMVPYTTWKFSETFPWTFTLIDVYDNLDGIVTWIRVESYADVDGVISSISMAYAGLARVSQCQVEREATPEQTGRYSIELDYEN